MRISQFSKLSMIALIGLVVAIHSPPTCASDQAPVTIRVGTTPTPSERMTHDETRPGYLVELFNRIEPLANVKFEYIFANWDQVLRLIRTSRVEAGFNSSFKAERAIYGAYPMKDGEPDPSRATIRYAYSLFTYGESGISWDGQTVNGLTGPIGIEKGAAIISTLKNLELPVKEIKTYESMVSLLAGRRLQAIAAVDDHLELAAKKNGHRFGDIKKLTPPLQTRVGYLMFSKRFCDKSTDICEAIWDGIRTVKNSDEYKAVRAQYGN